jgi:hypothetical protein
VTHTQTEWGVLREFDGSVLSVASRGMAEQIIAAEDADKKRGIRCRLVKRPVTYGEWEETP